MSGDADSRFLCSQLVTLRWSDQSRTVNLEEISRTHAILDSDESLPLNTQTVLVAHGRKLHGTITAADVYEFGWRIRLNFSPLTPWSPDVFVPDHLLDISGRDT